MNKVQKRRLIAAAVALCVSGWLVAASLAVYAGKAKLGEVYAERSADYAEKDAADWRRKAGKAYTELLVARSGGSDGKVTIPAGTQIDGTFTTDDTTGRVVAKVTGTMFYPPKGY